MNVKVRDFIPALDASPEIVAAYNRGIEKTIKAFSILHKSSYYNETIERQEGESTDQYIARLKNNCIELLCSNRGWAATIKG